MSAIRRLVGLPSRSSVNVPVRSLGRLNTGTLVDISVSHLYNLRKSTAYTRQRYHFEKTRPTALTIRERRKPRP